MCVSSFLSELWKINLGLHAFTISILLTELSLSLALDGFFFPPLHCFFKILSKNLAFTSQYFNILLSKNIIIKI